MKRRYVLIVSALLIIAVFGIASVEGVVPVSPDSPGTLHTTSVDIQVINVVPGLTYQPGAGTSTITGIGVDANLFPGITVNATAGFAFAPSQGYVAANTVLVTIVYFGGTGGYNGFQVSLNGHSATMISTDTVHNTVVGALPSQTIVTGANSINIGISPIAPGQQALTYIYQVKVTVEYNYTG